MITAELRQKRHRRLGTLGGQLAVDPVQCMRERGSLVGHIWWKQVTHRDVEGKPSGVEPADEAVGIARGLTREGGVQHPQCICVGKAHGPGF